MKNGPAARNSFSRMPGSWLGITRSHRIRGWQGVHPVSQSEFTEAKNWWLTYGPSYEGFGRRPLAQTRRHGHGGRRSKAPQGGNRVLEGRWRRGPGLWGFRDRRVRAATARSEDRLSVGWISGAAGGLVAGFDIRDGVFPARKRISRRSVERKSPTLANSQ